MRILLDLDGLIANFAAAALHAHGAYKQWPKGEWWIRNVLGGMTEDEMWAKLPVHFYDTVYPMPDARQIVETVKKYDDAFYICTAMSAPAKYQADLVKGKVQWCQRFLGKDFKRIKIVDEKWELGRPGRLLIDDSLENVEKFIDFGGQAILYPRPWNDGIEEGFNLEKELKDEIFR